MQSLRNNTVPLWLEGDKLRQHTWKCVLQRHICLSNRLGTKTKHWILPSKTLSMHCLLPPSRFERLTPALQVRCSTPELRGHDDFERLLRSSKDWTAGGFNLAGGRSNCRCPEMPVNYFAVKLPHTSVAAFRSDVPQFTSPSCELALQKRPARVVWEVSYYDPR